MKNLSVFISYASEDLEKIYAINETLQRAGYETWFDQEKLLPGQDWDLEISNALSAADFFIACISSHSVTKSGYVQKELKRALSILDEQPEGKIYLIPVRLEECKVPHQFQKIQYCDLFHKNGMKRLLKALHHGIQQKYPDSKEHFEEFKKIDTTQRSYDGLKICFLSQDYFNYSRKARIDFCIINNSAKHKTITDLSVEILKADSLEFYSIVTPGAPFEPVEYDVMLDPFKDKVRITAERFMYQPNERDDFRLNLYSIPGWKYKVRISGICKDIIFETNEEIFSEEIYLEFPDSSGI